ncbi:anthranilate phosphoribosyltransferase [Enterobacterales bacterium endosymbiont of Anomoneura mori]|uniref:anthranilate phosphoribosyltransferase n=1 Tax=Enterobacterales bacterium endosymbiont of Anomoneura mori TaxID=3132096 RepID=UPI00399D23DD
MVYKILEKIFKYNFINKFETYKLFNKIYYKKINKKNIISFLITIKIRGYYIDELLGSINLLLKKSKKINKPNFIFSDIVGTGGDNINSINISTISALIASTYGIKVIKHGNYGISNVSGSFNILKKFNVNFNINSSKILNYLNNYNICFLFASKYNSIFNKVIEIRKKIKSSTLFNIIGPLINPLKPPIILIGVNDINLILIIIKILKILKYKNAAVVHGGGLDEVAIHSNTYISELKKNNIKTYQLEPEIIGLKRFSLNKILNFKEKKKYENFKNILKGKGNLAHNSIISANIGLLLKLFNKNNLLKNVKEILKIIKHGNSYKKILHLIKE